MTKQHFASNYASFISEMLHSYLISTWCYKHEIIEVPGIATALLITYDNIQDDVYETPQRVGWERFISRMSKVKNDWAHFSLSTMQELAKHPDKTMMGWEGRTIYFIKGDSKPEYWTAETANIDSLTLLITGAKTYGPMMLNEIENIKNLLPTGTEHFKQYEDFIRKSVNFLFIQHLGEGKLQQRTEPGDEGLEIRDIICSNKSNKGFWADIKQKYSCTEVLFEAKNKSELTRGDLRQIYCYLKPALGLWGFIVCREEQPKIIHDYNRTLFKNFVQERGVLILTDQDIIRMAKLKVRNNDPSEYLAEKMSDFVRSI